MDLDKKVTWSEVEMFSDFDLARVTWHKMVAEAFQSVDDFAFLNDLRGIVRDSGILTSCGSCFGSSPNSEKEGNKTDPNPIKAYCGAISSVFVPDLTASSDTSHDSEDGPLENDGGTIRRTREYAKYRE